MTDKAFPDGFTASAAPMLAQYAMISNGSSARKVLLSDIAELFAESGSPLADLIASGSLTNPTVYASAGILDLDASFWQVAADYFQFPPPTGNRAVRILYAPGGVSLQPDGYPTTGYVNGGAAGAQVAFATGLYIVTTDGADTWGVINAAIGGVVPSGHASLSVPVSQSGTLADLVSGSNDTFLGRVAGAIAWTALTIGMIANNLITRAKLAQGVALSIIGRSANSTGDVADISTTNGTDAVLRESGGTLGFGTIATAGIANSAITLAKIAAAVQSAAQGTESLRQAYTSTPAAISATAGSAGSSVQFAPGDHTHKAPQTLLDLLAGEAVAGITATKTANHSIAATDVLIPTDTTAGNITHTAPSPATAGRRFKIKKTTADANTISLAQNASEQIDGTAGTYLCLGSASAMKLSWTFESNGTNWLVVG
jgi:hypothetical protein